MTSNDFLIKIKIAMLFNKISLKELAERTNINLRTLSRRFANPNNFTLEEIIKINEILNMKTVIINNDKKEN